MNPAACGSGVSETSISMVVTQAAGNRTRPAGLKTVFRLLRRTSCGRAGVRGYVQRMEMIEPITSEDRLPQAVEDSGNGGKFASGTF